MYAVAANNPVFIVDNTNVEMADFPHGNTHPEPLVGNVFSFTGNGPLLSSRIQAFSQQEVDQIVEVELNIVGEEIQPMDDRFYILTIVVGSLFLFPFLFFFCDWWKKCIHPAYELSLSDYKGLARLLNGQSLKKLALQVTDNTFDLVKANAMYDMISKTGVKEFRFINQAGEYDFNGDEYSHFVANMMPIKLLKGVTSQMKWGSQIVQ